MAKSKKAAKKKTVTKASKKKVLKKKAVAKPSPKAAAKPKQEVYVKVSTKLLGEAPKEYEFYLKDGRRLKNLFELVDALEDMQDDLFKEHVNEMKNDFSNWIKDVFGEVNVAKEIEKISDRIETQKALLKRLIEAAKQETEQK
ncbi:hypothetical protein JW707_02145 [Candidatus Woesearchaeota archaeon]|nr:hypothetical protein [Candidatus Woesearchaeota archaeon]